MRLICVLLLCLVLVQALKEHAVPTESNQPHRLHRHVAKECGEYTHQIVKPMLAYFDKFNQKLEKNEAEMESKNSRIKQLEEKEIELQLEVVQLRKDITSAAAKDKIIKLLEDKEVSNVLLIKLLQEQKDLSAEKHTKEVMELEEQIKLEANKAVKCESKLKSKEEIISANDRTILQLKTELKEAVEQSKEIKSLTEEINILRKSKKQLDKELTELKVKIKAEAEKSIKCENKLQSKEEEIVANKKQIVQLEIEVEKSKEIEIEMNILKNSKEQQKKELRTLKAKLNAERENNDDYKNLKEKKKPQNCLDIDSPGVHNVTLCGGDTFKVLCSSDLAGPGWTVIQQRIKGGVNFQRDWTTYRNGFGDFWQGDFFLGLEKIHRLTNEQPHELYIHMESFEGATFHARYDEFAISDELDQYRLSKLGAFSGDGSTSNWLRYHKNSKFTTYDRDNDEAADNCAASFHGGWWYYNCAWCNLNGKYFETKVENIKSIHWYGNTSLKKVRMMIRPKAN